MERRKLFGRRRDIVWVALVAAALSVPAAIADEAGSAGLKKDVKKALALAKKAKKKAGAANKKAKNALAVAEETSKQQGPKGEKGDPGANGAPGADGAPGTDGVDGLAPTVRSDAAATVSTNTGTADNLGGPSAIIDVGPGGGFARTYAKTELDTGAAGTTCQLLLNSASLAMDVTMVSRMDENGFDTFANSTMHFLPEGSHTFNLLYKRNGGTGTCQYRNRLLLIALFE